MPTWQYKNATNNTRQGGLSPIASRNSIGAGKCKGAKALDKKFKITTKNNYQNLKEYVNKSIACMYKHTYTEHRKQRNE